PMSRVRKGADGLVVTMRAQLRPDPFSGMTFIFRSKRADRSKTGLGVGRGSWIRTNDLQYPKLPRYQAALYPDVWERCRYTVRPAPARHPALSVRYTPASTTI